MNTETKYTFNCFKYKRPTNKPRQMQFNDDSLSAIILSRTNLNNTY